MPEFLIDKKATDASDKETLDQLTDGRKISMFIDEAICRDVYFDPEKGPLKCCRVDINGFCFRLFPGENHDVPEAVATLILTSPDNSKYARYSYSDGSVGGATKPGEFNAVGQLTESIRAQLAQNQGAAQQLQAVQEIMRHA